MSSELVFCKLAELSFMSYLTFFVNRRCFHLFAMLLQLKVMQQKNLKPLDSTLAKLSVGCSKDLELDLAEHLLDQISECPYPYPYNAFLAACDKMVS